MLDIGWPEMLLVGTIALIVVGPKELPRVLMTCARYWRQVRGMAMDFRGQFDDLIREAELDEVRRSVQEAGRIDIPTKINMDHGAAGPAGSAKSQAKPAASAAPSHPTPSAAAPTSAPADPPKTDTPETGR